MNRSLWIAAAVLLVGAGLWMVVVRSGDEPVAEVAAPDSPPAPTAPAPPGVPPETAAPSAAPVEPEPAEPGEPAPSDEPTGVQPAAPEDLDDGLPMPPPERVGPVEELKQAFETEPRDSAASEVEADIRSVLREKNVPPGLFGEILCRKTVCRLEVRWTGDRASGFVEATMGIIMGKVVKEQLALEPLGPYEDGMKQLYMYLERKPD